MLSKLIRIGREEIHVQGESLADLIQRSKFFLEISRRCGEEDAYFTYRENEGGEFIELYSPGLRAKKKLSKYRDQKIPYPGVDYFFSASAPWVRWDKEKKVNVVLFNDSNAINYDGDLPEEVENEGFVKGEWAEAEYVQQGKQYKWVKLASAKPSRSSAAPSAQRSAPAPKGKPAPRSKVFAETGDDDLPY